MGWRILASLKKIYTHTHTTEDPPKNPELSSVGQVPCSTFRFPLLDECSRNSFASVYQLVLLWEAAFSFSEVFSKTFKEFAHFMMGDLQAHLPTPCRVFSSFWPKNARTLVPHPPYSPNLTPIDYFCCGFPEWKVLTGKRFASVEGVKQKTAEALKGIKIDEFKNWFWAVEKMSQ